MWLKRQHDAFMRPSCARRCQRRRHLGRMVAIVVDQHDLAHAGAWKFVESEDGARSVGFEGEYLEIDPGRRLVFTWSKVEEVAPGLEDLFDELVGLRHRIATGAGFPDFRPIRITEAHTPTPISKQNSGLLKTNRR